MTEPKLKPCPFCGSTEVFVPNQRMRDVFSLVRNAKMEVVCTHCGVGAFFGYYGKGYDELTDDDIEKINKESADGWNKRAVAE